jgi:hypothetical protein
VSRHGKSQKPPEQNPEQHSASDAQLLPDSVHTELVPPSPTGPHLPLGKQLKLQHSAGCPHFPPSARQVSWQVWVIVVSQTPLQQGASGPQGAPMARHCPGSFLHRPLVVSQP